jgi:hypothetical protein
MGVVDCSFDQPLKAEEHASMSLAGGLMQQGYQCGMLWGAALAAGAQAYRLFGTGSRAECAAIMAAQRLVESFRARNKEINCFEITEMDLKGSSNQRMLKQVVKFFIRGGPIGCFRMAGRYAPLAFNEINIALPEGKSYEEDIVAPSPPVSCAAMLAQRMGASDMHVVMAAGLAGGIGLCGGGCGALGAAIWITGLNYLEEAGGENMWISKDFQSKAGDRMDRFLKSADFEFECSKITGRRFESIEDHAEFLRGGGCSRIIESLAA